MAAKVDNKPVILITGSAEGSIGCALAHALLQRSCCVYATDLKLDGMQNLAQKGASILVLDVTDKASIKTAVDKVIEEQGRIDMLVNSAGFGLTAPVAELDIAMARKLFDVNYFGMLEAIQAVFPHMAARRSGHIVNISSICGLVTSPFLSTYCDSKFAVRSMTDALRLEAKPFGISVTLAMPGTIKTNFVKAAEKLGPKQYNLYKPWEHIINNMLQHSQDRATDVDELASRMTEELLRSDPPAHFIYGERSEDYLLMQRTPVEERDSLLAKVFKLDSSVELPK